MSRSLATPDVSSSDRIERTLLGRYEGVQAMVIDYALALAILGLFRDLLTPVLMATVLVLAKMLWDMARRWRFAFNRSPIGILGQLVNMVGAAALALVAWVSFEFAGGVLPGLESLSLSAALMSGTWTLGATFNTFFLNGFLRRHQRRLQAQSHA